MDKLQFAHIVEDILDECKTESEVYIRYDSMLEIIFEYAQLRMTKIKTLGIICNE